MCCNCAVCSKEKLEYEWDVREEERMNYNPNQLRWIAKRKETELNRLRAEYARLARKKKAVAVAAEAKAKMENKIL